MLKYVLGILFFSFQVFAVAIDSGRVYIEIDNQTNYHVDLNYGHKSNDNKLVLRKLLGKDGITTKSKWVGDVLDNRVYPDADKNHKVFYINNYDFDPERHFASRPACVVRYYDNKPNNNEYTVYKIRISEQPGHENCHGNCPDRKCELVKVEKSLSVPHVIFYNYSDKPLNAEVWVDNRMIYGILVNRLESGIPGKYENNSTLPVGIRTMIYFRDMRGNPGHPWEGIVGALDVTGCSRDTDNCRQIIYSINKELKDFNSSKSRNTLNELIFR